jgi:hypothetical protein
VTVIGNKLQKSLSQRRWQFLEFLHQPLDLQGVEAGFKLLQRLCQALCMGFGEKGRWIARAGVQPVGVG